MKNKQFPAIIIIFLLLGVAGCKDPSTNVSSSNNSISSSISTSEISTDLPPASLEFIDAVKNITFTGNSKDEIDDVFEMFENLADDEWDYDEVLDAYEYLCALESLYNRFVRDNNAAENFISRVTDIPYQLQMSDEKLLQSCEQLYASLSDEAKNMVGVAESYQTLLAAQERFDLMYAELINESNMKAAQQFITLANQIPDLTLFIYDDISYVNAAQNAYDALTDEAKEIAGVTEAYTKVTEAQLHYEKMTNDPSIFDGIIINVFLTSVEKVPALENITLNSYHLIYQAVENYKKLTKTAQENETVIAAKAKLDASQTKYYEIYLESVEGEGPDETTIDDLISEFSRLVELIPAISDIAEIDGKVICAAEIYYKNFARNIKNNETIKQLNTVLVSAREAFNAIASTKLSISVMNILSSTDTIPNLVLQGINYSNIRNLYGVSNNQDLKGKAGMNLYVYHSSDKNTAVYKESIDNILLEEQNLIIGATVKGILEMASVYDESIVSGAYYFGIEYVDYTGQYAFSDIVKNNTAINYTFENRYNPDPGTTESISIHNVTEFLAIKNNLAGNYKLVNDIDLANIEWENMGDFTGTLDGNGHTVYNLTYTTGAEASFGLFFQISVGAAVKNLTLEGTIADAGNWAGAIAVRNYGTIINCLINMNVSSLGNIGGIVCENYSSGVIENCLVYSTIQGGSLDGGLAVGNYGRITNSYALVDNISNGLAIGNNPGSSLQKNMKTEEELTKITLYETFDKSIWHIVSGYLPHLIPKGE